MSEQEDRVARVRQLMNHLGLDIADLSATDQPATHRPVSSVGGSPIGVSGREVPTPDGGGVVGAAGGDWAWKEQWEWPLEESPPWVVRAVGSVGVTRPVGPDLLGRCPTVGEYLPRVFAAAGLGARRTYGTYWDRMRLEWGDRRLDEIAASDVAALVQKMIATARVRRNHRRGRHAGEHVIAAARAIYNLAVADGLILPAASPAHRIAKPRRLPNTRRALSADELDAINHAARVSGNDPVLDALLLRLHTETACRRGGALGLRVVDLDTEHCLIRLEEKGSKIRWQPVSPPLAASLAQHANARGGRVSTEALLRFADGRRLTTRRYDHLWARLGRQLPWVAAQGISIHWLRHTTLTWVERHYGYGIARAYAGHTDNTGPATTTYIKADLADVATALAGLTAQPHPLAHPTQHPPNRQERR